MDFNRDGEVSFDEFVRWYSMSSALQNTEETRRQHQSTAAPSRGGDPSGDSTTTQTAAALSSTMKTPSGTSSKTEGRSTAEHAAPSAGTVPSPGRQPTAVVASRPRPVAEQTSRLMADLEELTLAKRPPDARSANGRSAASAGTAAAPSSAKMPKGTSRVVRQKQDQTTPWKPSVAASASARGRDRTVILAPTATSSWAIEDPSGRRVATDAEMDAFRERWLAGGTFSEGSGVKVEVPTNPRQGCGGGDGSTAEENLEKALELLTFLVNANADADTLIAALASRMIRNPTGRWEGLRTFSVVPFLPGVKCNSHAVRPNCTSSSYWGNDVAALWSVGLSLRDFSQTALLFVVLLLCGCKKKVRPVAETNAPAHSAH